MASKTKIQIDGMITVGSLAEKLSIPVTGLITELMKNGIMATVNEKIDFETAQIIVEELGLDVELLRSAENEDEIIKISSHELTNKAKSRPPVVAVMGHVDHGKTSLLDAIRSTDVAKKEAGGITQHISAYQIKHNDRLITFLDTPGHEAFAAIRQHGAALTDIAIIVVAADDGVKPQTIEAIRYAKKAGVKIIVAINKIDKEGADSNRIKQQLSEHGLMIEEWGGDTVIQEVSAKTKKGIPELLDLIFLVTDIEDLKADYDVPAYGLVIESHVESGRGSVARALVEGGVIRKGDYICAGSSYAKIRNLEDSEGRPLKEAGPSTPVIISGFKTLPEFGDEFNFCKDEKEAKNMAEKSLQNKSSSDSRMDISSSDLIRLINRNNKLSELNVIIKADVQGSLISVMDSLKSLDTDEVAIRFVGSGIGQINENDLHLAHSSNAIIYGFNVSSPRSVIQQASRDKINIRLFDIIYEMLDDAKKELSNLLAPEVVEKEIGKLIIKGIFNTTKTQVICGGEVTTGKVVLPSLVRVIRDKKVLAEAVLHNLKRSNNDVKEVNAGEMCGIDLKTKSKIDLVEGDKLEFFSRELVQRKL
jgi:translation initiation factor IF-2